MRNYIPGGTVPGRIGILVFFLVILGPLLALVVDLGQAVLAGNTDWLVLAIPKGRRLWLLAQSVGLAAGVSAGGIILGILSGSFLWRWRTGISTYLRWFVLLLVAVPPHVHALAWISVLSKANSSFLIPLGFREIPLHGWLISWWVQLMALAPISVGLTLVGLELVERSLIEAGRLLRPDIENLKKIIGPLAMPAILASGGFVFLLSLTDYSVPSLFQANVYSLEIFARFSAESEPASAFLLALPLLVITVSVVIVSQAVLRNAALKPIWRIRAWSVAPEWPGWFIWLQRLAVAILALQVLVPLISLTMSVGTWGNLVGSASLARREIAFTLWTSTATALVSIPLAFAVAKKMVRPDLEGKLCWLLVTSPLAVPAPLIGIGLIAIWNRPLFSGVYGSDVMPVLATLVRFTPFAAIIILAQFRRIDPLLIDATRVFQTNLFKTWYQVRLPMLAPGLLAAAFVVFALSAGELGATLMVAPPGQATLIMKIYNYLHYGASESVAGLCLLMTLATLMAGILAVLAMNGWSSLFPRVGSRR